VPFSIFFFIASFASRFRCFRALFTLLPPQPPPRFGCHFRHAFR
jgi:hypothetical protein